MNAPQDRKWSDAATKIEIEGRAFIGGRYVDAASGGTGVVDAVAPWNFPMLMSR